MFSLTVLPRGTLSTALCLLLLRLSRRSRRLQRGLWALLPFLAGRCFLAWRRWYFAYGRHPGTAQQRALCFNPSVQAADFEERFIGKASSLKPRYDFIVIGSGSSGCAVAARLARAALSPAVLLVEAGGEAQQARQAFSCWQSEIDWGFRSTPQQNLLPKGRVLDLERGKTLGGSSAINYNLWVHGAPQDFDRWETQYGCTGWSYKDVLPHFQCLERVSPDYSDARGKEGPIAVAKLFPALEEVEDFMKACEENADAQRVADYNAGSLAGVSPVQLCTDGTGGGRQDCFSTLVEPLLRSCPNFHVISETFCRRVLLEGSDGLKATGVELELRSGKILQVQCDKEVILSAGALLSPQLLMLSGIGDAKHLKEHGIPCVLDLPAVGRNLSDHPILPVLVEMPDGRKLLSRFQNSCGTHGVYFWQSKIGQSREERLGKSMGSDLETIFNSRIELSLYPKVMVHEVAALLSKLTADYRSWLPLRFLSDLALQWGRWKERGGDGAFSKALELMTILNHPQSRGAVKLRSADPHAAPAVDPNYLSEKEDVDAMVEAFRRMLRIFSAPSLAPYVYAFHPATPAVDATEAEISDYVRSSIRTTWHYSCTTRMGPATKENVCDPQGRVHGVKNLRVADAGLMPEVVSGNTHAACVMIGDRIGSFIVSEHAPKL